MVPPVSQTQILIKGSLSLSIARSSVCFCAPLSMSLSGNVVLVIFLLFPLLVLHKPFSFGLSPIIYSFRKRPCFPLQRPRSQAIHSIVSLCGAWFLFATFNVGISNRIDHILEGDGLIIFLGASVIFWDTSAGLRHWPDRGVILSHCVTLTSRRVTLDRSVLSHRKELFDLRVLLDRRVLQDLRVLLGLRVLLALRVLLVLRVLLGLRVLLERSGLLERSKLLIRL